jgi:hypothetical protein
MITVKTAGIFYKACHRFGLVVNSILGRLFFKKNQSKDHKNIDTDQYLTNVNHFTNAEHQCSSCRYINGYA